MKDVGPVGELRSRLGEVTGLALAPVPCSVGDQADSAVNQEQVEDRGVSKGATSAMTWVWAWPENWDGEAPYCVFDCPRLWFNIEDDDVGHGPVHITVNGDLVTCVDSRDGRYAVWRLTDQYDSERHVILGVWPD